jgi:hypothetical protein
MMRTRKNYAYQFHAYNQAGHATVEAFVEGEVFPTYTLTVPMTRLYKGEVAYILDAEEWDASKPDGYYKIDYTHSAFTGGETPKLISWWVNSLPNNRSYFKMRRRNWQRHLRQQLRRLYSQLVGSLSRLLKRS